MVPWILVSVLALVLVGTVAVFAVVASLAKRVKELEAKLVSLNRPNSNQQQNLPQYESPLRGLRVGLLIEQDHKIPILVNMLEKELATCDVAGVFTSDIDSADIVIEGRIVCNSYTDSYYQADIRATRYGETVFSVAARPANGDRTLNLARELVANLEHELSTRSRIRERQQAIEELGS